MPIDSKPYCSFSGFDAISTLFQEIIAALNSLNVVVEQVYLRSHVFLFSSFMGGTFYQTDSVGGSVINLCIYSLPDN